MGVSGGVDSVVLFHVLAEVCSKNKHALEVLHINYGLRGTESDEDAAFVRVLAAAKKLPFHELVIDETMRQQRSGESVQEWARHIRYEWFQKKMAPGDVVALAHHHDDLAENILLRLSRGSRVAQALGMEVFKDPFWRPLLEWSKREIKELARGQDLPYREDSSNDKLFYGRNRIRHEVLPVLEDLYPQAKKRIVGAVEDVSVIYGFLRKILEPKCSGLCLERDWLKSLPAPVQREAIEFHVEKSHGERRLLPEVLYDQVMEAVADEKVSHWAMELPQGGRLVIEGNKLRFQAELNHSSQARYAQYREQVLEGRVGAQLGQNARLECAVSEGMSP